MTIATELRSLSVQDYHRMVEVGILAADERVELIDGIEQQLSEQDSIAPLAFPDCVIQVGEFLRSPAQTSRA